MRRNLLLGTALFVGVTAAPAAAQTASAAEESGAPAAAEETPADTASDASGADIIVTAQRREQRLQDVPVSVAAFSGQAIREMAATTVSDIITRVPGVRFQAPAGNSGFPVFNIRGVTVLDFTYTNEASVALYADDVYLGNPAFATLQLFDLERVEVLRGPQGTLYGRNATGGLVQYVSRRPTDVFEMNVMAQYASFNDMTAEVAVSGPLADGVRARIAGRINSSEGWQTNLITRTHLASVDYSVAVRGMLEVDLAPEVELTVSGHYSHTEGSEDGRALFGARVPGNLGVRCAAADILASRCANQAGFIDPDPDPRHVYSELPKIPYELEAAGGWAKLEADLGFASLTSVTAYEWGTKFDAIDTDASHNALINYETRYFIRHEQLSQELRLAGDTGPISWQLGGYYYGDKRFFTAALPRLRTGTWSDQKIRSYAGFADVTWALTDSVNINGGIRYTSDRKNLINLASVADPVIATRGGTPRFTFSDILKTNKVTWRLGADWHVTPDHMLYISAATGFKSGGYNTGFVSALSGVGPVSPESITTYEVGFKTSWLDRALTINGSLFHSDYKGIQAAASVPCTVLPCTAPSISVYLNIGDAKISGGELEVQARPVSDLTITLAGALNYNKVSAPPTVLIAGVPLDGKRLANTPRFSGSAGLTWEPSLGEGSGNAIIAADINYATSVFFRPENNPLNVQEAYALVNARIGWKSDDDFRVELFATNLTDEEYFVSSTDLSEEIAATWGRPRQFGIRVSKTF
ncbi:iron complex outermembrane recepter protein [Sphingopyxis sp. YR583]|uniref:TonB-dependent receptor n=1 Tax=Sphingopyxis sp. YR583 TaxID=1881047 RepID=UPI0008A72214|nr:TonB-dependent receptor [Sphingopyxis sp. YR583]SEH19170.1 iron complex outermembrane recepter protein [Sphingopyxis sp. YR583]